MLSRKRHPNHIERSSGAKKAAEKVSVPGEIGKGVPQGLKPVLYFDSFAARLKSCPDACWGCREVFQRRTESAVLLGVLRHG
jgi:hypothetical protein